MTDRRIDIISAAQKLPKHSAIIYRHFGDKQAPQIAKTLRQICFQKEHQFLIGQDPLLAIECGADGVHFAQNHLEQAALWRRRLPGWLITGATHDRPSLMRANALPLDAVTLSPVFETQSPGSGAPLGLQLFTALAQTSTRPVFALGGITEKTAAYLIGSGASGIAGISAIAT